MKDDSNKTGRRKFLTTVSATAGGLTLMFTPPAAEAIAEVNALKEQADISAAITANECRGLLANDYEKIFTIIQTYRNNVEEIVRPSLSGIDTSGLASGAVAGLAAAITADLGAQNLLGVPYVGGDVSKDIARRNFLKKISGRLAAGSVAGGVMGVVEGAGIEDYRLLEATRNAHESALDMTREQITDVPPATVNAVITSYRDNLQKNIKETHPRRTANTETAVMALLAAFAAYNAGGQMLESPGFRKAFLRNDEPPSGTERS